MGFFAFNKLYVEVAGRYGNIRAVRNTKPLIHKGRKPTK